jgi:hypothetical protein
MRERVVQIGYIEDTAHKSRFVEVSDEMIALFEQWAVSQDCRVEWHQIDPFRGLVSELQEWRDLLQRLQNILQVTIEPGDLRLITVLRAAVARLEGMPKVE